MDPVGELNAVAIDCADPLALARFWAAVLGTGIESPIGDGTHYVDLVPAPGISILRFQRVPEPKLTKNRLHLDLSVRNLDEACARVEALGGRRVSRQAVTENGYIWTVMQDPEGNEFCVGTGPE
jgi:predicted enzyme related to lactoylglutathione lyase